jgi:hypothetical protein
LLPQSDDALAAHVLVLLDQIFGCEGCRLLLALPNAHGASRCLPVTIHGGTGIARFFRPQPGDIAAQSPKSLDWQRVASHNPRGRWNGRGNLPRDVMAFWKTRGLE